MEAGTFGRHSLSVCRKTKHYKKAQANACTKQSTLVMQYVFSKDYFNSSSLFTVLITLL